MSNNFDRLRAFIEEMNLIDPVNISSETTIERDLGITGDDAVEFIQEFSETFKVDVSGFEFSKYFGSEGIDFGGFFARLFTDKKASERVVLKLSDLEDAIKKGKLI